MGVFGFTETLNPKPWVSELKPPGRSTSFSLPLGVTLRFMGSYKGGCKFPSMGYIYSYLAYNPRLCRGIGEGLGVSFG